MNLEDTIDGMISSDFRERLKAEYQQVSARVTALDIFLLRDDVEDRDLLELQLYYMTAYRHILVIRANHLGIKL